MNFGADNRILQVIRILSLYDLVPPLWAFVVMYPLWRWVSRDRAVKGSVPTLYEPPQGVSPAEAAMLVDNQVDAGDIIATIVDLSLRGYIKIVPRKEKLPDNDLQNYTLTLLKDRSSWKNLAEYELEVLSTLFPLDPTSVEDTTTETTLSDSSRRLYWAVPSIRAGIYRSLRRKGFLAAKLHWNDVGFGVCLAMVFLPLAWLTVHGFLQFELSNVVYLVPHLAALVITLVIVAHFWYKMVHKTRLGSLARTECISFKEFLTLVDGDRLKRLPPEVLPKIFPYAIAFGVEQHYAKAFPGLDADESVWSEFEFLNSYDPSMFGDGLNAAFTASAHSLLRAVFEWPR